MTDERKRKQAERSRRYYLKNKELVLAKTAARRLALRTKIAQIKQASPCVDCDEFYPYYVMQYDHIGSDKTAGVSDLVRRLTDWKIIEKEIAKCELVCANCHAIRTWTRHGTINPMDNPTVGEI